MKLSEKEKRALKLTDEQLAQLEKKYPNAVLRTRINKILLSNLPDEEKKEQCRQLILRMK